MSKNLYIKTYGCYANVYDSDKIIALLKPLGYKVTDDPANAQLAILNTCHIREKAEQKVLSDLGRLNQHKKRACANGKDLMIAVGGCVGQAEGEQIIKQAPYVSLVFGPQNYHKLPQYLARNTKQLVDTEFPVESKFDHLPAIEAYKTSAFISIQEGCDKFCTFCVVPYTRGAEYSRPVQSIVEEAKALVAQGVVEITLLGQNVNAYHGLSHQQKEVNIAYLIKTMAEIDGLQQIRYTTSHPCDMDDDLIRAHAEIDKLMPHLHLPVQSGSSAMLKRMNRRHTKEKYYEIIEKIKSARNDILVSSDFIIGFPGETDEDHRQTVHLIQDLVDTGFSFNYSPRPGTPASIANDQIPDGKKFERLYEVQDILRMKQLARYQQEVGKTLNVLVEKDGKKKNQLLGKSPYLQSVCFEGKQELRGKIIPVKITAAYQNTLEGIYA